MKRAFDFACAGLGLLVLSPLLLIIAICVRLYDGGPAFFVQERIGRGGRPFRMLKFRSMRAGSEKTGAQITVGADQRITPLGKILRKAKLDELPQLWNVFKGEMSLVGPRPEVAKYVNLYTPEQAKVLELTPGITDPSSFAFFEESELLARAPDPERYYRETVMAEKIRINLEYASRANLWTDLVLIFATLAKAAGLHWNIFAWLEIRPPTLEG